MRVGEAPDRVSKLNIARGRQGVSELRVTRDPIRLGKKALDRLPGHLRETAKDPARAGQVVGSFAAAIAFGVSLR